MCNTAHLKPAVIIKAMHFVCFPIFSRIVKITHAFGCSPCILVQCVGDCLLQNLEFLCLSIELPIGCSELVYQNLLVYRMEPCPRIKPYDAMAQLVNQIVPMEIDFESLCSVYSALNVIYKLVFLGCTPSIQAGNNLAPCPVSYHKCKLLCNAVP